MKRVATVLLLIMLAAAGFLSTQSPPPDADFPIYFENSVLSVKSETIDRVTYLPLLDIVRHLGLAFTDATGEMTLTIQGQGSRLLLNADSASVFLNDQTILLQDPIRRQNGQWLAPLDFLSQGLSRVAGQEFRYKPGSPRVFSGKVTPGELAVTAQPQGANTRLTLRSGSPLEVELQRETSLRRATLILKGRPIDPTRERVDYKDALVQSISFQDADGVPKLVVAITDEVRDIRVMPSEENRLYYVDFVREGVTETPSPAPAAPAVPARPLLNASAVGLRVIAIDAGHGGIDSGTTSAGTLEKDLTLALARRLRTALQSRLAATVVLTRDSDVAMTNEDRTAVANNNQAGLLISLHTGYSPNTMDSGASIYIMSSDFTGGFGEPAGQRLFYPWYMAYRIAETDSEAIGLRLQQALNQALPGWKFPLRHGPIGVLASATMPAVVVEIGNLNNDVSVQTLTDPEFQSKLAATIAGGVEQFVAARSGEQTQ